MQQPVTAPGLAAMQNFGHHKGRGYLLDMSAGKQVRPVGAVV